MDARFSSKINRLDDIQSVVHCTSPNNPPDVKMDPTYEDAIMHELLCIPVIGKGYDLLCVTNIYNLTYNRVLSVPL